MIGTFSTLTSRVGAPRPRVVVSRPLRLASVALGTALTIAPVAFGDEVISDPELAPPKPADAGPSSATVKPTNGQETISDPELGRTSTANPPASTPEAPYSDAGATTWRVVLETRWGVDTAWTRPNQDIFGGTTVGLIEAQQRTSKSILFSVGLRARHGFGMWRNGTSYEELDVQPVSGFVDARLAEGLHLRAGYQVVTLGRFDLFSATDFLAVRDLRSGPFTMPDASAIAQPALNVDYDATSSVSLEAYYLPFFQPDVVALYGTDNALLSPFDRVAPASTTNPPAVPAFGRSATVVTSKDALSAWGPPPDLRKPQGALRATLHGTGGELAATVGTALERLPAINAALTNAISGVIQSAEANMGTPSPASAAALGASTTQIPLDYGRFYVASVDGATDLGPIQSGFEAAYMKDRVLPTTTASGTGSVPGAVMKSDVLQLGLRAEYASGEEFGVGVEGFGATPIHAELPPAESWLFFRGSRSFPITAGAALGGYFAPEKSRLRFELGAIVATGPSYVVFPRVQWEALTRFYLELGAGLITGPGNILSPNPTIGGVYRDVGQVFTGIRWMP